MVGQGPRGGERCRGRSASPGRALEEQIGSENRRTSVLRRREGSVVARPDHLAAAASPARRPGTLTVTKLIQDLEETENLYALYRQAGRLTSDATLRGKMDEFAADEARGSQTIRAILGRMDSYVTDLP